MLRKHLSFFKLKTPIWAIPKSFTMFSFKCLLLLLHKAHRWGLAEEWQKLRSVYMRDDSRSLQQATELPQRYLYVARKHKGKLISWMLSTYNTKHFTLYDTKHSKWIILSAFGMPEFVLIDICAFLWSVIFLVKMITHQYHQK